MSHEAEVVLAGDVFYDQELADQGFEWLEALQRGGADVRARVRCVFLGACVVMSSMVIW